jgi:hypothetical protein
MIQTNPEIRDRVVSPTSKKGPKIRLQFDFSERSLKVLDELVETLDAASRAEVIRNALYSFSVLMDTVASGGTVTVTDKEGKPIQWMFNRPPV